MTAKHERVLAIAVASGRFATVLVVRGKIKDWRCWRRAFDNETKARSILRVLIAEQKPDVIVLEDPDRDCPKAGQTLRLLRAFAQMAQDDPIPHLRIQRSHGYRDKYEEAKALAEKYPELDLWVPPREACYASEPKRIVVFEALALADWVG